jgi:hypothetical protein
MALSRIAGLACVAALAAAAGCVVVPVNAEDTDTRPVATVRDFDDTLSPYGEWVVVRSYGRVWRPYMRVVGAGFVPYVSGGYWANSDVGWTFVSSWSWGWAPFHYGRWYLDAAYGWVWVPDMEWGPAWVEWRYGGGFVGWAPLPPPGVTVVARAYTPHWYFCEAHDFVEPNLESYVVPYARAQAALAVTAPVAREVSHEGRRWYLGPEPERVYVDAGRPIRTAVVRPPRPGRVERAEVRSVQERRMVMPSPGPERDAPPARPAFEPARPAAPPARPAFEPERTAPGRADPERERVQPARPGPSRVEPAEDEDKRDERGAQPGKKKARPGRARPVGEPREER